MKLSRTVGYAIQATLQLAERKSSVPVPCSHLAAEGEMPERFLLQILRSLVNHGVLRSTRGVEGGYKLDRDASEISLLDIVEAVDGPLRSKLPSADKISLFSSRTLERALSDIAESARERLAAISLSQLVDEDPSQHQPPAPATEKLPSSSAAASSSELGDSAKQ